MGYWQIRHTGTVNLPAFKVSQQKNWSVLRIVFKNLNGDLITVCRWM